MAGKDLEKFIERYPTYIEALEMLETKDQRIAELEQELAEYKELQDRLGLENVDEFEWFVMLDLLTDNEKNMHILDLHRELAALKEKAIVPKFKVGQEIWCIQHMTIFKFKINKVEIHRGEEEAENRIIYGNWEDMIYQIEENCFATEQEAQAKLKEIQGNE